MKIFLKNPASFKDTIVKGIRKNVYNEYNLLNDFKGSEDYEGYEIIDIEGEMGDLDMEDIINDNEYGFEDVNDIGKMYGLDIHYYSKIEELS